MEKKRWESEGEVRFFESSEELSTGLADYVHHVSESALSERSSFSLALSGGDIPERLGKLARLPYLRTVEWSKWHLFWAEENVVPKRHPDSFYMQAKHHFISKVPIQPAHVVPACHETPGEAAADRYEFSIRQQVKDRTVPASPSSDCPRFDLVLLSLGPRSQVSSLHTDHPVLLEGSQWVAPVSVPGEQRERLTFTLPVINAAANVAIVASGSDVASAFREAMVDQSPMASSPARMIRPADGKLVWFVDAGAASLFSCGGTTASASGESDLMRSACM
ncbi:probable 6-phosphogluconolactonase 1 [Rhodamnia argentea]|uniref:Probable 6-phosphogluconolactonase n=1 Tax=Rhodamnia argentea TaxID=178133 RepID=A0A8B8QG43_9MYRT|nr:probable 6-phosphogluconolactonase 1 [Rhodamnia argentea]